MSPSLAPSLHHHCYVGYAELPPHAIPVPALNHHNTIPAGRDEIKSGRSGLEEEAIAGLPSLHHHRTITAPSLHQGGHKIQ